MKEDYKRIASDEKFKAYIEKDLTETQKMLFDGVLWFEDRYDFDVLFKKVQLLQQQERFKARYEKAKKLNEDLLTSSSWKATEGLRSLKHSIKK